MFHSSAQFHPQIELKKVYSRMFAVIHNLSFYNKEKGNACIPLLVFAESKA